MNTYECDYCGADFQRYPSQVKGENRFCSTGCHSDWRIEQPPQEHNSYNGGPVIVECAECGCELERRPCKLERSDKFFCSTECESAWKTGRLTGENHPNWKGGKRYNYGPDWHSQREKRLEHDNYKCVVCGKTQKEEKDVTGSDLTVHHVQPLRKFGEIDGGIDYGMANRLTNLVTLCKSCHRRWEGIPVRPVREP